METATRRALLGIALVRVNVAAMGLALLWGPSGWWQGPIPPHPLRRILVRPCLDWTEGRPHLAGWLGAAICERLETVGRLKRSPKGRACT